MKSILLLVMFCASVFAQSTPSTWGQIVKTKKETYGHEYFVYFKDDGKDFAYPLSSDSSVGEKRLESMVGKYAKIYGSAEFEKAKAGESRFIMAFKVKRIDPLSLKDLNENISLYEDRLSATRYVPMNGKYVSESYTETIDNATANTAITVGGAALAVEVLANILKGSN
ncbi:MAG: hypothetical protein KC478_05675 [Bacteriovoracaceae bacterium]|nr:hypothetical protein [Bacteriovoracaceae bacterium]